MKFKFSTKLDNLSSLKGKLTQFRIPILLGFSVAEWIQSRSQIIADIKRLFDSSDLLAIRSSSTQEDSAISSMAGCFTSLLNIPIQGEALDIAITEVIDSYKLNATEEEFSQNQVIVQKMVSDVSVSGVLFTQDMNTGSPYYVINYDDITGKTDSITAGNEYSNRTLLVNRSYVYKLQSTRFLKLLRAVQELEEYVESINLDIEFAIDRHGNLLLLQVRPITTSKNWNRDITLKVNDTIECVSRFVASQLRPKEGLAGSTTIYSQMSDWNPAEMIGSNPRPLALSLYQEMITNHVWRDARVEMGYQEPTGAYLIHSLAGKPYVDVRASFHSFLPEGLSESLSNDVVDAWLQTLNDDKSLHDKVEFKVATTIYTPDVDQIIFQRFAAHLSKEQMVEYRTRLHKFTQDHFKNAIQSLAKNITRIESLDAIFDDQEVFKSVNKIVWIIERCKRLGTLPFSVIARHAFIATEYLNYMKRSNILDNHRIEEFYGSCRTITKTLTKDIKRYQIGEISEQDFISLYGHLRPGTYDILSPRYCDRAEIIQSMTSQATEQNQTASRDFNLSETERHEVQRFLESSQLKISPSELMSYIRDSIYYREYSKYIFTKSVSILLESIAKWAENIGLTREEVSYLSINDLINSTMMTQGRDIERNLRSLLQHGREQHDLSTAIQLPLVISKVEDCFIVPLLLSRPNFITQHVMSAPSVHLTSDLTDPTQLDHKIVLIEGADPGYDWIFGRPIAGLITKFGGVNSHMAIRCAEFSLPAAIGCGEQIFDRLIKSNDIELNCKEQKITPLSTRRTS